MDEVQNILLAKNAELKLVKRASFAIDQFIKDNVKDNLGSLFNGNCADFSDFTLHLTSWGLSNANSPIYLDSLNSIIDEKFVLKLQESYRGMDLAGVAACLDPEIRPYLDSLTTRSVHSLIPLDRHFNEVYEAANHKINTARNLFNLVQAAPRRFGYGLKMALDIGLTQEYFNQVSIQDGQMHLIKNYVLYASDGLLKLEELEKNN